MPFDSSHDRHIRRFLKTALFFCGFCGAYLALGQARDIVAEFESARIARAQLENDIYARMGLVEPAAGETAP